MTFEELGLEGVKGEIPEDLSFGFLIGGTGSTIIVHAENMIEQGMTPTKQAYCLGGAFAQMAAAMVKAGYVPGDDLPEVTQGLVRYFLVGVNTMQGLELLDSVEVEDHTPEELLADD